jgi:hypothetical protein
MKVETIFREKKRSFRIWSILQKYNREKKLYGCTKYMHQRKLGYLVYHQHVQKNWNMIRFRIILYSPILWATLLHMMKREKDNKACGGFLSI